MKKSIIEIAKDITFELEFGRQFETTLTGFFYCVCGKLHMYSWMNRNCPQCGRSL